MQATQSDKKAEMRRTAKELARSAVAIIAIAVMALILVALFTR